MIAAMIALFVIGYVLITLEHTLKINKSTFTLLMCGGLWAVYTLCSGDSNVHHELIYYLGDTCEIVVFLICAMTIVEIIDRYGGFDFITQHLAVKSKVRLLWVLVFVTFFMSAALDNMTTSIIIIMMLRRLLSEQKERWMFAGVIVLAANSGGAWSPIGDITTIMLWMSDKVTSDKLVLNLLLPSIASVVVPTLIATRYIKKGNVMVPKTSERVNQLAAEYPQLSKWILFIGVIALLFVPVFKSLTGLPPFMGMLISLGVMWFITEVVVRKYNISKVMGGRVSQAVRNIDMPTILFFLGILMSVSALQQAGILTGLAGFMNEQFPNPYIMTSLIGCLSSIIDNVPLVSACIKMFSDPTVLAGVDVSMLGNFQANGLFWHLLTYTSGVGGSLLIIGSAAGVVAMGIEKIPFFWYLKHISLLAFVGYLAGIGVIALEQMMSLL